jgi:hypothetical protein
MQLKPKKKDGRKKDKGGRPTKLDDLTVKKLEEAFAIDATVLEACAYADISRETFYNWSKANPALFDRFEMLRQNPMLKARNVIVKALQVEDIDTAKWYAERKAKAEFSTRQELTGPGGAAMLDPDPETKKKIDKIFKENM